MLNDWVWMKGEEKSQNISDTCSLNTDVKLDMKDCGSTSGDSSVKARS